MRYRYLFINDIPLLYSKKSIAKQMKVTFWLDPRIIMDELKLKVQGTNKETPLRYIV